MNLLPVHVVDGNFYLGCSEPVGYSLEQHQAGLVRAGNNVHCILKDILVDDLRYRTVGPVFILFGRARLSDTLIPEHPFPVAVEVYPTHRPTPFVEVKDFNPAQAKAHRFLRAHGEVDDHKGFFQILDEWVVPGAETVIEHFTIEVLCGDGYTLVAQGSDDSARIALLCTLFAGRA